MLKITRKEPNLALAGLTICSLFIFLTACSSHQADYENYNQTDKQTQNKIVKNESENISEYIQNENFEKLAEVFTDRSKIDLILNTGRTALIEAIYWSKSKVVSFLIKLGADPLAKDSQGLNALQIAETNKEILILLKPEILTELRLKLFDHITAKDTAEIKVMLEEGIDLNFHFTSGETPLILAIKNKSEAIVRLFLQPSLTTDSRLTDQDNISPLMWAEKLELKRIIKMLQSHRKD